MKRNANQNNNSNNNNNNIKKGGIADEIAQLKQRREDRKNKEEKKNQLANQCPNDKLKMSDDIFEKMMRKKKVEIYKGQPSQFTYSDTAKIFVVVRKRPISKKEIANGEIDCVSVVNPRMYIHECKIQIDGITKYLEDHEFYFDNAFGENNTTEDVYDYTISSMINLVLNQGIVTCFAYGQTGSGKTYTMKGIESLAIEALYSMSKSMNQNIVFFISFFEIYGGRLFDLLNNKNKLQVLDDKNGKVQIFGLEQKEAKSQEEMHSIIDFANSIRTTRNTVTNETSSRSHAICNIVIKYQDCDEELGKLSLVDLAGSERAQETQSNNRQRRAEGAEINKSLLALKECIRALDERKNGNPDQHIPFRASKLTHVLRDSFVSKSEKSKIIMIACVNPSYSSANHSINTLRYSDRLKEQTKQHQGEVIPNFNPNLNQNLNLNLYDNNNNNSNSNNNNNNYDNYRNNQQGGNNNNNMNYRMNNNNVNNNNNNNKPPSNNRQVYNRQNEDINMNPLNSNNNNNRREDNNKMDIEENHYETPNKYQPKNSNIIKYEDNNDDWDYLRKTANREGKMLSEEYIKYHQLTDKIVEDEDDIINSHMNIIKDDAKLLTEEGDLITNIKGVGKEEDFKMDEYISGLDRIINRKLIIYSELRKKLDGYKKLIKEEDELRSKLNPKYFIDND